MPQPKMLTVAEVAAMAGRTPTTVYRWIREGHLRAWRMRDRTLRLLEPEVKKFLRDPWDK